MGFVIVTGIAILIMIMVCDTFDANPRTNTFDHDKYDLGFSTYGC